LELELLRQHFLAEQALSLGNESRGPLVRQKEQLRYRLIAQLELDSGFRRNDANLRFHRA
jgi:hypothetical protein